MFPCPNEKVNLTSDSFFSQDGWAYFFWSMFAIFETGGKQYRAEKGAKLKVELLPEDDGDALTFDRVYLVNDGKETHVGTPYVEGATVSAKVVGQGKADKIRVVKFKAKKRQKTIHGHRQQFSEIEITALGISASKPAKKEAKPEVAAKEKSE